MDDSNSMLAFVLNHLPDYWDPVPSYTCSNMVFSLSPSRNADEYYFVESMFYGAHVSRISRVQNPFTYGRFMLRREMIQSTYEDTVFHGVHKDDLKIALKFNCDYRRYARKRDGGIYENSQHPMFYKTFSDLLNNTTHAITDINVLVVKILTDAPKTQCDYYVQYIVKF
ncbi:uncharacterized protein LOC126549232 [Aphis gossypii]|uniref:Uncharacterized protein n=1 Tax=Aphis gossypii TaxID=80765 RepID=A0A9P0IL55_APHGO|nr:uncharacterized protein LOC114126499 [Aphis gossypii]XP_050053303.1 uncharacterized protein LOC126549028 [Aphis gossypii]XP_050053754.1 uncharacterized protein LOC126549221 [Aphis gossypii]XP_050053802.1 uncharacterized protein LOC126549232 [Aphis gossypii]CAH1708974.1 unnamed protein product [Aphis gossypii]